MTACVSWQMEVTVPGSQGEGTRSSRRVCAPPARLLAAAGIHVDDISWSDLELFLGRGRMPVLETVTLKDLLDYSKRSWSW